MTSNLSTPLQGPKTIRDKYLCALLDGPKANADLRDRFDAMDTDVSRMMAKLTKEGWTVNAAKGQPKALYTLTDTGRARAEAVACG